jgi:hypothetical protein
MDVLLRKRCRILLVRKQVPLRSGILLAADELRKPGNPEGGLMYHFKDPGIRKHFWIA